MEALKERYEQWEVQEEQKLLMELTNVQTEEELYQKILDDMLNYNKNSKGLYDDYIGIFQNFLAEYKSNLEELQRLKEQELTLTSVSSYLGENNIVIPTATMTGIIKGDGYHFDFSKVDEDSGGSWTEEELWYGDPSHASGSFQKESSVSSGWGGMTDYSAMHEAADAGSKLHVRDDGIYDNNNNKVHSFADGLKGGPVTYTGLAMLHGTPNEPEYILNNDQAYNLLYNISSARMADFEAKSNENSGVQYIVQGDIILEGIEDPAKFWQEVTNAMGNRWNVTKNK